MKLVPISSAKHLRFTFVCAACGRRAPSDSEGAKADIDGPAFAAYYCGKCAAEVKPPEE